MTQDTAQQLATVIHLPTDRARGGGHVSETTDKRTKVPWDKATWGEPCMYPISWELDRELNNNPAAYQILRYYFRHRDFKTGEVFPKYLGCVAIERETGIIRNNIPRCRAWLEGKRPVKVNGKVNWVAAGRKFIEMEHHDSKTGYSSSVRILTQVVPAQGEPNNPEPTPSPCETETLCEGTSPVGTPSNDGYITSMYPIHHDDVPHTSPVCTPYIMMSSPPSLDTRVRASSSSSSSQISSEGEGDRGNFDRLDYPPPEPQVQENTEAQSAGAQTPEPLDVLMSETSGGKAPEQPSIQESERSSVQTSSTLVAPAPAVTDVYTRQQNTEQEAVAIYERLVMYAQSWNRTGDRTRVTLHGKLPLLIGTYPLIWSQWKQLPEEALRHAVDEIGKKLSSRPEKRGILSQARFLFPELLELALGWEPEQESAKAAPESIQVVETVKVEKSSTPRPEWWAKALVLARPHLDPGVHRRWSKLEAEDVIGHLVAEDEVDAKFTARHFLAGLQHYISESAGQHVEVVITHKEGAV